MRKSTVSKEQGIVRGGGGRRAKRVHKTRSDVADGKVLRVAPRNHEGVQTPWQVNESGHWRRVHLSGAGYLTDATCQTRATTSRKTAVNGAERMKRAVWFDKLIDNVAAPRTALGCCVRLIICVTRTDGRSVPMLQLEERHGTTRASRPSPRATRGHMSLVTTSSSLARSMCYSERTLA